MRVFLGSHLCRALLAEGHRVLALDNFLTGRRDTIQDLLQHPRFSLREWDVTAPYEDCAEVIFNLAAAASPPKYQADPIHTLRTNVLGTDHALQLARRNGALLVQASTSEIYGDPECHPQPETYVGHVNPLGPRACYDEGKRAAETLCFDYRRMYGTRIKVMRLFNTYGPAMDLEDGRVVSNFLVAALRSAPLLLQGGGHQTRSFCYVSDTIAAMLALMRSADQLTGPYNIGNPQEVTVRDLALLVQRLSGTSSPLQERPAPVDDPKRRCPDIAAARADLGWAPSVPLERGLRQTLEDFRARLAMPPAQPARAPSAPQDALR